MVNVFDPIGMGIVDSLASPGRDFTGLTSPLSLRMLGKRLQLLKDAFHGISRLAVLRTPNFATDQVQWDWLERAAPAFNVKLIAVSMGGLTTDPQDTAPRSRANELFLGDSAQDDPQILPLPPLSR